MRKQLEGASRCIAGWITSGLRAPTWDTPAQPLGDAGARRRCISRRVRRLGPNQSALVTGRHAHRLHLESQGNTHIDSSDTGGDVQALEIGDRHYRSPMDGCILRSGPGRARASPASASPTRPDGSMLPLMRGSKRTTLR